MNEIELFEKEINIKEFRKKELARRTEHLKKSQKQKLSLVQNEKNRKLHITYVMTWTGICGGSKIILEHTNRLVERGHKLTIISHYPYPNWFSLNPNVEFVQVPSNEILCESIPKTTNLIVVTYWREIYEAIEQNIAPVVYFEQGDFHLFDSENVEPKLFDYIYKQIQLAPFIYTVSSYAQKKLREVYNVDSKIIPNAVNDKVFYPTPKLKKAKIEISMIGSPNIEFKRITDIISALTMLKQKYDNLNVNLITPEAPNLELPSIDNLIINPEQRIIGDTLRETDIFVCASMYESFCLPVLEALTCGCSIVTTNNGGINDFCKNDYNCLIIKKQDVNDIIEKIELLINDSSLRKRLSENSIKSSKKFSWENITNDLENYYEELADYQVISC